MKISVITPSFNQGEYIGRCINSVREQNFRPIEHIVLDNCSSDGTAARLGEYGSNSRGVETRLIVERDAGQTHAINKGFGLATGDVLCWLNTDEYYVPDSLASVAAFLEENPDVDIAFGDCVFVNGKGVQVGVRQAPGFDGNMLRYYGCYIPSCATFIRRRVIEQGFLLDSAYRVCMDFEYYVRLHAAGIRFAHISKVLAHFTWHETNVSNVQAERRLTERRQVQAKYGGYEWLGNARFAWFDLLKWYWVTKRSSWRLRRRVSPSTS